MISESKLNLMYDLVIESGALLSTKSLKEMGFNTHDINKMMEDNTLIRVKRGVYKFNDIEKLFYYGKFLASQKGFSNGTKCFERCYEIDKTHLGVCFQLFLRTIQNEDYEKAILLMEELDKSTNKFYRRDYNFYLYCLNILTMLPEKLKKRVQAFKLEDLQIIVDDMRYHNKERHNAIRISIYKQKFHSALKDAEALIKDNKQKLTVQDIFTRNLAQKLSMDSYRKRKKLRALAETRDYKEIINILENKELELPLTFDEFVIKKLAEKLFLIENGKSTFEKFKSHSHNLIIAIDNNDFEKALKIREGYCIKNNITLRQDTISFMLNDLFELARSKEMRREDNEYLDVIEDIKYFFEHQNLGLTINLISNLLYELNLKEYESLAINIIKLDAIINNELSKKAIKFLKGLIQNEFDLNIKEHVDDFIMSLAKNEKNKSEIYLKILEEVNNLLNCKLPINKYQKALHKTQDVKIDEIQVFQKHEEMLQYGISIFENVTLNELALIGEKLASYNDVNPTYYEDGNYNLIIRNKVVITEKFDRDEVLLGDKAYEVGDYQKSLEHYLKVLYSRYAKADTYAKIGFIYYKLGVLKKSLDYFKVAQALSKNQKISKDYELFATTLEDQITYDEQMLNSNDNFGLGDITYITDFIAESELDINTACSLLRLNEEEVNILMLVYARNFYFEGNKEKGDELLNMVLQKDNLTLEAKKIINFLLRNKDLYFAGDDSELKRKRI